MISVIIPVYNVEKYIDECIQSVINQTYSNFECILINDGSTDNSGTICDKWAEIDRRIKVIHQTNQGVSSARNVGINYSSGEYITFIDSDDYIESDYLEHFTEMILKTNSELYLSGLSKFHINGNIINYAPNTTTDFLLDISNIDLFIDLNQKYLLYGPVAKLYVSNIIKTHHIQFPLNYEYGEDLIFNYQYLKFVNYIYCKNKAKYHYRILDNSNSLSSKIRDNQFNIDYKQWLILKDFYISKNLWCHKSKELLYKRLWGIIYDNIINNQKKITYTKIKQTLSIPDIKDLKTYKDVFKCSGWIKFAIIHRCCTIFKILNLVTKL